MELGAVAAEWRRWCVKGWLWPSMGLSLAHFLFHAYGIDDLIFAKSSIQIFKATKLSLKKFVWDNILGKIFGKGRLYSLSHQITHVDGDVSRSVSAVKVEGEETFPILPRQAK